MAIVFDRDFGRVWSDGTSPYVFSSVVRVPQMEELDELAEKQLDLIKELRRNLGEVYSILDLRLCPLLPIPILQHYAGTLVRRQFESGLKYKAIAGPSEIEFYEALAQSLLSIADLPVSIHNTFEDALNTINEKRTREKREVIQTSVYGFFRNLVR